ncbi:MAG: primosomal protein N' [Chthonomonadaceae bacterium]|nr:primosomal protein N' [Chthonomonadaceae bacterium]
MSLNKSESQEGDLTSSLWEEFDEVLIADVIVDVEAPDLQPTYSYRIPESLLNEVKAGDCVHVNFAGREILGYVISLRHLRRDDPLFGKLKDLLGVIEEAVTINEEQIHLVRWMSERYLCDLTSAVRCVAPSMLLMKIETVVERTRPDLRSYEIGGSIPQAHLIETIRTLTEPCLVSDLKAAANLANYHSAYSALLKKSLLRETRRVVRPKASEKTAAFFRLGSAISALGGAGLKSEQQRKIVDVLSLWERTQTNPMPRNLLLERAEVAVGTLNGLVERGIVTREMRAIRRTPVTDSGLTSPPEVLTPGQQHAIESVGEAIESKTYRPILLFGVTASGKTEVYLNAIAQNLKAGRSAIVLVPEIALTAQVVDIFLSRFGDKVAVIHSQLSNGEKHDEWKRLQNGEAQIVVGPRSAIFAPVKDVGLIVLDEEHEASYKQETNPRYNARDLALERARICGATVILGSATPSLETFYASRLAPKDKKIEGAVTSKERGGKGKTPYAVSPILRVEMKERIDNRALPKVRVVDLREEFKEHRALFSRDLTQALGERLRRKEQSILFLNRRGYAQFVLCRDCGFVAKCPNCAVSLAYHAYDRSLRCHHCDFSGRAPQICPDCGGNKVKAFGIGTEKVEEEVVSLFPEARVARLDRDTTSTKGAHTRIIRAFREGESDILIGTQMVAKGLDFPAVTLVGVVSADTAINMPDFRAAERTFQLLTQVAGRAGRGKTPGEVIIQTFSPDHYAVVAAIKHDYKSFYEQEDVFRKELRYPPYSRFANLVASDVLEKSAERRAERLAAALGKASLEGIEVIGPSPAPLARLRNLFRFHVALRAPLEVPLSEIVRTALATLSAGDRLSISTDIDPLNMS